MSELISKHGGYKTLKSYQMSEIIFDFTMEFCKLYINQKSRTVDQMQQAARSGKQNIAEGSVTSGTSKQSELRLVMVARASLEELLADYQDFLRTNNLPLWSKEDWRAVEIRRLAYRTNRTYTTYKSYLSDAETAANCAVCVIHQTNFLLDQQIKSLEMELKNQGDFKDRYKQVQKNKLLNDGPPIEEFLQSVGLRSLHNGRVVKLDDPERFEDS